MRSCSRAVFTTPGTLEMYANRFPEVPSDHLAMIANGYDEEDFATAERDVQDVAGQGYVGFSRASGNRERLLHVADATDSKSRRSVGYVEREAALVVRVSAERRADDADACGDERLSAAFHSDASAYAARLCKGAGANKRQQQQ